MTYIELVNLLESKLNIPVAYDHFTETQKLPFITINDVGSVEFLADDLNYWGTGDFDIHYHFKLKNLDNEKLIEKVLNDNYIQYEKTSDIWIDEEKRYTKTYEVNING